MSKTKKTLGDGHKSHISVQAKAVIEVDGKKQEFNIDYDVTVTVEMIEYAVQLLAGRIAEVADNVAKNGIKGLSKAA